MVVTATATARTDPLFSLYVCCIGVLIEYVVNAVNPDWNPDSSTHVQQVDCDPDLDCNVECKRGGALEEVN